MIFVIFLEKWQLRFKNENFETFSLVHSGPLQSITDPLRPTTSNSGQRTVYAYVYCVSYAIFDRWDRETKGRYNDSHSGVVRMEDQRMKPSHMHSKNYLNKHLRDHHMPFVHGFTESSRDYLTERESLTENGTGIERDRSRGTGQFRDRNKLPQEQSHFGISFVTNRYPSDPIKTHI